jgi:copper chaperone CopZ
MTATTEQLEYSVPGVSCGHCVTAITQEVTTVQGVQDVDVDLSAKRVRVRGEGLDAAAVAAAIDEAGYDAEQL